MGANGQVWHLLLVFPTERAAQPPLFLGCFRVVAQDRDAFVADVDPSGSGNQTLDLVLLFAAKGAHKYRPPLLIEDLDDVRPHLLQAETKAFQHPCSYAFPLAEQAKEEMLGPDVVVLQALRLFLGKTHHMPGSLGEPVEAPSLVHACFGSLSTGTGPAVTSQPSADRAKKFLSYHLLILSVCLLPSIRRASTGSPWPRLASHTRARRALRETARPSARAWMPGDAPRARANRCTHGCGPTSAPSRYRRGRRGNALASASTRRPRHRALGREECQRGGHGASSTQ